MADRPSARPAGDVGALASTAKASPPPGDEHAGDRLLPCRHTALGQRFYCLFVIEVGGGVVRLLGSTTNPNVAGWPRWRGTSSSSSRGGLLPHFLVRDHDSKFTAGFDEYCAPRASGPSAPVRAPWRNAYAERCVRTGPKGLLDHLLVLSPSVPRISSCRLRPPLQQGAAAPKPEPR